MPCQYASTSHELSQITQIPQISNAIAPQVPTTLHHSPTTLHQASGNAHQVHGTVAQMTNAMAPNTMSNALQTHTVISGHLSSFPASTTPMQLAQVSTMQPPAAHGTPSSLAHNTGK